MESSHRYEQAIAAQFNVQGKVQGNASTGAAVMERLSLLTSAG